MTIISRDLVYAPTGEVLEFKHFNLSSHSLKVYTILLKKVYELYLKCVERSINYPPSIERSFSKNAIYQFKKTVFKPPEFIYERLEIRSKLHYEYCIQILQNYVTYYLGWEKEISEFITS